MISLFYASICFERYLKVQSLLQAKQKTYPSVRPTN